MDGTIWALSMSHTSSAGQTALRVLFVNRMAALERGGGETFDLEMAAQLARLGCEVTLLCGWPVLAKRPKTEDRRPKTFCSGDQAHAHGKAETFCCAANVYPSLPSAQSMEQPHSVFAAANSTRQSQVSGLGSMVYLRSPYLPWFPWDKVKGGWRVRVWEFQQFEKKAARWIQKHADRFDIIQICELPYLVLLLRSPIDHCPLPIVLRLTAPNVHDAWGGVALADAVIASGTSIEKIRATLRPDVHDVPNGVDTERFGIRDAGYGIRDRGYGVENAGSSQPEVGAGAGESAPRISHLVSRTNKFRYRHGIPDDAPVLLYVARFQAFKNHRMLAESFVRVHEQMPEARLLLAGSGPLQKEIRDQCRKAGLQNCVLFLGEVPFEDLPAVYAAANLKLISSEYESFCFAALEAMASGLPIVSTDCGWVPRLMGDELPPVKKQWAGTIDDSGRFATESDGERIRPAPGGLIVSRAEPQSLANAIMRFLKDPGEAARCGKWNRERAVERHGWEASARKLLDVYEGVRTMDDRRWAIGDGRKAMGDQ